mgnify:FL=1
MKSIRNATFYHLGLGLFIILSFQNNARSSEIITTIKPVYSLVKEIVGNQIAIDLLVEGQQSSHNYQIKPSQLKKINKAKIIFYVSPKIEHFIAEAIKNFSGYHMELADVGGLEMHVFRKGGAWDVKSPNHKWGPYKAHEKENGHEGGKHKTEGAMIDPHIWLSPANAKILSVAIAEKLSLLHPDQGKLFLKNAKKFNRRIDDADRKIASHLKAFQKNPFIVFHDAYQYFEKHYNLTGSGSIAIKPDESVSIKRLSEIKGKIKDLNVTCVFKEPQFSEKLVKTVTEDTKAKISQIDPLGSHLDENDNFYIKLLFSLSKKFGACLR